MRKVLLSMIAVAAFLLNPLVACDELFSPSFQFSDVELRAVVEGTWTATFTPEGSGKPQTITFRVEQARAAAHSTRELALIPSANACGHRTLIRSAEACIDATDMPLAVIAIAGPPPVSASFVVPGTEFRRGYLGFDFGNGTTIDAVVSNLGEISNVNGNRVTHSSLARVK